jgi:hypothetical protein
MAAAPKTPPELLDRNAPAYSGTAEDSAPASAATTKVDANGLPVIQLPDFMKQDKERILAEQNKTTGAYYDQIKQEMKDRGLSNDEARQQYMKDAMAAKANLQAEGERTRNLRMAEFFATWGSTPGDTLAAGMTALKAKIPDMITDAKDQRKALAEANDLIYKIGEATRQEELGNWDKATKLKEDAAGRAEKFNERLSQYMYHVQDTIMQTTASKENAATQATAHIEGNKIMAAAGVKGHEIAAAAQNFATQAHMAQNAAMERGRVDANGTKIFDYNLGQLNVLREKLSNVLNTGLGKELSAKILAAAAAPDNTVMQNIAKEARTQLNNMTNPLNTQIEAQQNVVNTVGKKVFKDDWNVPSPRATNTADDPIGIRGSR